MELPKIYEPKKVEDKIYRLWLKSGFFNPDKLPPRYKKPYCIVIPPPNITGSLHMGHALNAVIQDILIRWRRLQGFKTLWLPGTDHAGIATQNVVEKELKKEGLTRFDLGQEKFIKRVWQWKKKYGNIILSQFKKIGSSLDWSRIRFTMDRNYSLAVETAFIHYYKKGWIYRGKKVINWCPRCTTSLSDLELEYKQKKGHLWFIKYPLKKEGSRKYIMVATTRPETMLGDTAVAVNPDDKRYEKFIGEKIILPLINREIPIIVDNAVNPKFGTGAVKVTPAHNLTDYEISLRHNLKIIQVIDEEGKITKETLLPYQGLRVLEARQKIVEDLKKQGFLEKVEDYSYQIPHCYRCAATVELIPSWQWFLKMEKLAKKAEGPVKKGKIKFHPKNFKKGYFDWLKNIKDWCLSRQIWWGHRLPVWLCQAGISNSQILITKQRKIKNLKLKIKNSSTEQEQFIVAFKRPKKCPFCKNCKMTRSTDVLDTWFSAALWPFAVFGWPIVCAQNQKSKIKNQRYCKPKKNSDLAKFYPTDVLSTDRGIINLWVARMIFSGLEFLKKIPFKNVYIHATVLTREGKRMSKSLGTGIDPIDLIEKYGSDATRFGITYQIMGGQDIRFVVDNILMGRKFCNKIWNASRFVLWQIRNTKYEIRDIKSAIENLTAADKIILRTLKETIKSVNKDLENFRFGQAAHKLYDFFWHNFCDKYIEQAKYQLSNDKIQKENTKKILFYVLLTSLKLLHPFVPFITEEIYQKLPIKNKKKSLMIEEWPRVN